MKKTILFSKIFIILYPIILFFSLELLNSNSPYKTITLLGLDFNFAKGLFYYSGLLGGIKIFIIYMLIFYLIFTLGYMLFNSIFKSYIIISTVIYLFYVANYFRKILTGWVLSPGDLTLALKLDNLLSFSSPKIDTRIIVSFLIIYFSLLLVFFCERLLKNIIVFDLRTRMLVFSSTLALVLLMFFTPFFQYKIYNFGNVVYSDFKRSQNHVYSKTGNLLGFYLLSQEKNSKTIFSNSKNELNSFNEFDEIGIIGDPKFERIYSQEYMDIVLNNVKSSLPSEVKEKPTTEKPNVIVIMSEAFWDPTRFDNITFSSDPIPNFRELSQNFTSGNIISPAFGGATCNPEYEFLTGNSMYFTGSGDIPYEMMSAYIPENDLRSIPQQFKNNGYKTVGVHTYFKEFFNRDLIYPRLGFDEFIAHSKTEELSDMLDAPIKGRFISDDYFTDRIIEKIEETEEPLFLYGISMENHYEYYPNKFSETDITSSSPLLTEFQLRCVDAYAQGIHDADAALKKLIDYVSASDKPTIIFFFGDHLPAIGEDAMEIYTGLDYIKIPQISEWDLDEIGKMSSTPYLLWSNYTLPQTNLENLSPYFIGPNLLELANLDKNIFSTYTLEMYKHFKAFRWSYYLNDDNVIYPAPIVQDYQWISNYFYLNYDYINGKDNTGKNYIINELSQMIK